VLALQNSVCPCHLRSTGPLARGGQLAPGSGTGGNLTSPLVQTLRPVGCDSSCCSRSLLVASMAPSCPRPPLFLFAHLWSLPCAMMRPGLCRDKDGCVDRVLGSWRGATSCRERTRRRMLLGPAHMAMPRPSGLSS
jgi:hypothetical protein